MGAYCECGEACHRETRKETPKTRVFCQEGQVWLCEEERSPGFREKQDGSQEVNHERMIFYLDNISFQCNRMPPPLDSKIEKMINQIFLYKFNIQSLEKKQNRLNDENILLNRSKIYLTDALLYFDEIANEQTDPDKKKQYLHILEELQKPLTDEEFAEYELFKFTKNNRDNAEKNLADFKAKLPMLKSEIHKYYNNPPRYSIKEGEKESGGNPPKSRRISPRSPPSLANTSRNKPSRRSISRRRKTAGRPHKRRTRSFSSFRASPSRRGGRATRCQRRG